MRLWSLDPVYLDRQGLLACWRESLLAQKVLLGQTKGYRHHPQLTRFRSSPNPLAALASYLTGLAAEAQRRGYHFDASKIGPCRPIDRIPVTRGQVLFEWEHLQQKLARRDPLRLEQCRAVTFPRLHPVFELVEGPPEPWEKQF